MRPHVLDGHLTRAFMRTYCTTLAAQVGRPVTFRRTRGGNWRVERAA